MNVNHNSIYNSYLNFNENIINPLLDNSKSEYPFSLVCTESEKDDIKEFHIQYVDAIKCIGDFLKTIVSEYGFHEISFNYNIEYGFNPYFEIKVPKSISSDKLNKYWDDIYEKIGIFAESMEIDFILDDLSIILTR